MVVKNCNGAEFADADDVTLIKGIRLTGDPAEIEGKSDKVKGLVLRTEFVKKA